MTSPALRPQPGILLVDDDPFMLGLQTRMLRAMGYEKLGTAGSAHAALAVLDKPAHGIDVIVCDLNMPGMDGLGFLQAVGSGPFDGGVILLSGEGVRILHTVQKLLASSRLTVLGALEKPAQPEALRELLESRVVLERAAPDGALQPIPASEVLEAASRREWLLHYQPKVSLFTGEPTGVEALVRWNHPRLGLVFPDRFIALAEECGAIEPLTDWVMRESIGQLARWTAEGLKLQMAVNISMDNLRDAGFVEHVGRIAQDAGVAPQDVTLEITESRAMSPLAMPLENLVRLRMQRFKLSIDDFGTGHSSLAQLRDVPFTELKVDRGFVSGARVNQIIRPMLEGSIGIAKRMGMLSVAEGVETEQDWKLLREIGCDVAQGYFIGRPMAADRLPAWLAHWQERRSYLVGG